MKLHHVCIILSIIVFACSKEKKETNISIGKIDSLHSNILNEDRKIWVYLPASYADTSKHYPVVYLLDGDSHFHAVTGLVKQLSGNTLCPEMIVVAIPNTDRTRDLTPTRSLVLPGGEERAFLKSSGGGENFTAFIEKELIPYVESHYHTAPHRVLIGHSFGGLFAVNTLIHHPHIFDSYLAIDPSLWWDGGKLMLQSDSVFRTKKFDDKTLFVSVANTMSPGMDTLQASSDTSGTTEHIRSIIRFSKIAVARKAGSGLTFGWKYYNEDDHGSVPLISEYDALRFMFSYYRLPEDPDPTIDKFTEHFKTVSAKLGYAMLPPEERINQAGYYFLGEKKFDRAFTFFDYNIKTYPGSQNVFDSMGDYYLAVSDTTKAIESFKKALTIVEVEATRTKLNELEKKK